ncbi:MAG: pantetheine-phosphate adenylyltransferase [Planctomycetaceae bacterium]|nr:pantetheine-phosphate adenylyltransferase [Planctomycetaceae bacterium]
MRRALYAGTFDPVTLGHLDLIERGLRLFPALTVGVADNARKSPLFTAAERVAMLRGEIRRRGLGQVEVVSFRGLVVDWARDHGVDVLLRGVRTTSDFEYEYQMALTNRALAGDVESVFVMPSEKYAYLSSTLIREVVRGGGDVSRWVPPDVAKALGRRLAEAGGAVTGPAGLGR